MNKKLPTIKCFVCQGRGEGTLFKDRDPIEGSKMSTLHTCLLCEGEGNVLAGTAEAAVSEAFYHFKKVEEDRIKQEAELRKSDRRRLIESAKSKLTFEEFEAIFYEKEV